MNKFLKIVYCIVFFALVATPTLYFFGAKEPWTFVSGWESKADVPAFTFSGFASREYQTSFTERYAKKFFPRATFLRTAYQLREYSNFGLFHYGYGNSILEGRDGILFERPYAEFHLTCPRPGGKAKYAEVMDVVGDMNGFCRTNGIFFAFVTMPDKLQAYPEYLPRWFDWFFDYSNYDTQGELAQIFAEAGVEVFDANKYLMERKGSWETWVYPPGGTHFNAYGVGLLYRGFVETFVDTGRLGLKTNPFLGVRKRETTWRADDDISNLMNVWRNPHIETNPHFDLLFERTNVVLNAGSMVTVGDCYRDSVAEVFGDAGTFDRKKIKAAPRGTNQDARTYEAFAGDLRVLLLCYQSFNTGRMDARKDELKAIFTALKDAVSRTKAKGKDS